MPEYRIGLQTITWGDWQVENMPAVLDAAAECGYDGVEIGLRRLGATTPDDLRDIGADTAVKVLGIHAGGNLVDRTQAAGEARAIDTILEYVRACDAPFVLYSGMNASESENALHLEIARLNQAAELCARHGVELLYHNHNWEFGERWRIMHLILHNTSEQVKFCPDVGWVYKAGVDPLEYLEQVRNRIGAVHFKDFATTDNKVDTVELGTGVVPFERVVAWMNAHIKRDTLWVIAEQDFTSGPVEQAVRANARYLKHVLAA